MKSINLRRVNRGVRTPKLILRELNRGYYQLTQGNFNREGIDIFEEDWDILCILDACRYDLFERKNQLSGDLSKVESRGSGTVEFLRGNVHQRELHDTVYVTANPQLHSNRDSIDVEFHDVWNVWLDEGWDDEFHTVLPETLTEKAIEASKQYPEKRIVAHYMQPHYPFVGEVGKANFDNDTIQFWPQILEGTIDYEIDVLREAYEENIEVVFDPVKKLLNTVEGKPVVTSDHGQMIGERSYPIPYREFGHPTGIHSPELVDVPWLEVQFNERRDITSESPVAVHESTDVSVDERLEQLGYKI